MPHPIVYFDIAGPDVTGLKEFYGKVFGWQFNEAGQFRVNASSPIEGTIRPDPAEKRIYVGVPDVTETLRQIETEGGMVDAPRFEVPGVVVLGLFKDPAGNDMGLVEMEGDRPRVP